MSHAEFESVALEPSLLIAVVMKESAFILLVPLTGCRISI